MLFFGYGWWIDQDIEKQWNRFYRSNNSYYLNSYRILLELPLFISILLHKSCVSRTSWINFVLTGSYGLCWSSLKNFIGGFVMPLGILVAIFLSYLLRWLLLKKLIYVAGSIFGLKVILYSQFFIWRVILFNLHGLSFIVGIINCVELTSPM